LNISDNIKKIVFISCLIVSLFVQGQSISSPIEARILLLSDKAEISLITCGPGNEVYTSFGHSAFRINDPILGIDRVYNYGTFDFSNPNFYTDFTKGNLNYFLSSYNFGSFLRAYNNEKRWVKGQVLDLQQSDVQHIFEYLENNTLPENREYYYDYFFDNCSTRLIDVLDAVIGDKLITPKLFTGNRLTHRELMQLYLGNQPWGDFGIDLCLGSVIDRETTAEEYLFLPDNVFTYFDALKIKENSNSIPIVKRTEDILLEQPSTLKKPILTPLLLFSLIGLLVIWITMTNLKNNTRSRWLDFSLFFIMGIIGLVISLIWFGTNHISAKNNLNVLWAFAPNLIVSLFMLKKQLPNWVRNYSLFTLILLGITLVVWVLRIQVFSIAVLPIIVFMGARYFYIWKYTNLVSSKK